MNVSQEIVDGIDRSLREAMGDTIGGIADSVVVMFFDGERVLAAYDVPEGRATPEETAAKLIEATDVLLGPKVGSHDDPARVSALFAAIKHHRNAEGALGNDAGDVVTTAEAFREFLSGGPGKPKGTSS